MMLVAYKVEADWRSSHQRSSVKKGAFKNFAKFTGKHLCQSLFNKVAGDSFFIEHIFYRKFSGRLLLGLAM